MADAFDYTVSQGDTFPSIALETGFFWKTLWNDGSNAQLKSLRKNPNVLYPGDVVHIPALRVKQESRAVDARYKFRRKGDPAKITIKLMKAGKPRANEPYVLDVEGITFKGSTDGDGVLTQAVPGDASGGTLFLNNGQEVYRVRIGHLDPVDTITGVQQRLINLGYVCQETGTVDDDTTRAVTKFQGKNDLQTTGEIDDATKSKLMDLTQ